MAQASSTLAGTVKSCVSSMRASASERRRATARRVSTRREVPPVVGVAVEVARRVGAVGHRGDRRRRRSAVATGRPGPARRARARSGVEPMLVSPMRASLIVPPSALTAAATADDRPLVRDAHELLVVRPPAGVLRDAHLGEQLALGDRRSRTGPGRTRSPARCARRPRPAMTSSASSASTGAPTSPAGSACTSAPPNVPRCRICGSATSATALASRAACSCTSVALERRRCTGVIAPMTRCVAVVADAAQRLDPAEVDERLGCVEPQPQDRQQATGRRPSPWRRRRRPRAPRGPRRRWSGRGSRTAAGITVPLRPSRPLRGPG